MALNTGKLLGKTAFIFGGARTAGKAIAVKLAKDTAGIVIASPKVLHDDSMKEAEAVAEDVVESGGSAVIVTIDPYSESSFQAAAEKAIKEYQYYEAINFRGPFFCAQACLPYLKSSKSPHILNITPPLDQVMAQLRAKGDDKTLFDKLAKNIMYTGSSMLVVAWATELAKHKIAVNGLWPSGGLPKLPDSKAYHKLADAAYCILTKNHGAFTSEFHNDEETLRLAGVQDFSSYGQD